MKGSTVIKCCKFKVYCVFDLVALLDILKQKHPMRQKYLMLAIISKVAPWLGVLVFYLSSRCEREVLIASRDHKKGCSSRMLGNALKKPFDTPTRGQIYAAFLLLCRLVNKKTSKPFIKIPFKTESRNGNSYFWIF